MLLINSLPLIAQKKILDTSMNREWPTVLDARINPNGKYAAYYLDGSPPGSGKVIESTDLKWRKLIQNCSGLEFTYDNKWAVICSPKDSLYLLRLGTDERKYIDKTSSFELLRFGDGKDCVLYEESDSPRRLVLRQLNTGGLQYESDIKGHLFNHDKTRLLVEKHRQGDKDNPHTLLLWDLLSGKKKVVWEGAMPMNYVLDNDGSRVAFLIKEGAAYSLWYYGDGMTKAERYVSDTSRGIDSNLLIHNGQPIFSRDGKKIFFALIEKSRVSPGKKGVQVDIWRYKDVRLQEDQHLHEIAPRVYLGILNIDQRRVMRLQGDDDRTDIKFDPAECRDYALLIHGAGPDFWWQPSARSSVYLLSLENGQRTLLKDSLSHGHHWIRNLAFILSPEEHYVVYYDPQKENYFSYDIRTGLNHNLTAGIHPSWLDEEKRDGYEAPLYAYPAGIAGWVKGDQALLVYDNFDIWKLDPAGEKLPVNLTHNYGRTHHIQFRLLGRDEDHKAMDPNGMVLLSAFDTVNKYNGFFRIAMRGEKDPELLSMGPFKYRGLIKAEVSNNWVVQRESAVEATNYFITDDFAHFSPLSDVQPQKEYNWLTAELVTWTLPDGTQSQGILYKPEDFDPAKKYPMLVHYYERRSNEIYEFKIPNLAYAEMNTPYFVSKGYLVFEPDIHYKIGSPGESAVNTVVSGVRYLTRNPWVDSTKIGLQGHSFGGWETNYLVTHTNLFAAASEGAGVSDFISDYGGLFLGQSRQYMYERFQERIGGSLWERQASYIDASPVLRADQVTTPLLMMHNKRDISVPWTQGVEFFTALRRLGRRAWMLQYDNGEHFLPDREAQDYTFRMTQFFDHYLKGALPPRWMTEGIPARSKGVETGYELDSSGAIP